MITLIGNESNGIYRDDGLIAIEGNGRDMDLLRKKITKLYKDNGLQIIVEPHNKRISYLDVVMDLNENIFEPYIKPNTNIRYINTGSNHPQSIIRELPKMIAKRLSSISSNKNIFDNYKLRYEEALKKSGYK